MWVGAILLLTGVPGRAADQVSFSRQIQPILSDNCFTCHGPDEKKRKADLRLDDETSARRVKDGKAAIVPGRSAASEAYRRLVTTDADDLMPPPKSNKKLTTAQIALLQRWIDEGATWGRHWAFATLERPAVPTLPNASPVEVRNPIDAFVMERLIREGYQASPEAAKVTLIRRVTLDLTGLPPTPEAVKDFVSDISPNAYETLVDRLLASPAYGERMAWDWMEAARYADSNGYQGDSERTMWPWRDWVIDAFNRNLPYDQFTLWQIAGDLLPDATQEQRIATGFCRNHPINGEGGRIPEENRIEYGFDMAETTGMVWLGLTFNCSRCHDHKFDPITRRDYYSLFAFFNQTPVDGGGGDPQTKPNIELASDEQKARLTKFDSELALMAADLEAAERTVFPHDEGKSTADSEKAAALSDKAKGVLKVAVGKRGRGQLADLEKELKEFEKSSPDYFGKLKQVRELQDQRDSFSRGIPRVMVMEDMPMPRKTFMLEKGLYNKPGDEVGAATPASLPPLPADAPRNRLTLARWLVSAENPLTARVTVNRFWQMFFGIGLVKTTEDFGAQGEFPKHPELLDRLAAEFRDSGWDVKRLIRLIVTSATYRQSSRVTKEWIERDPDNRLLARGPRFRMPSWMIRDQALAAGGLLASQIGGPPVKSYQPSGVWEEATFGNKKYVQDHGEALYRRSLYTFWRRIVGPTMFFDTPSRAVCTVKPTRTNIPLHALATLNDVTHVEASRAMAQRILMAAATDDQRVNAAFQLVTARLPADGERAVLLAGLKRAQAKYATAPEEAKKFLAVGESKRDDSIDATEHAAWTVVCLTVLNLDEALTKE